MLIREPDGQWIFDWLMAVHDRIWQDTNWPIVVRCNACSDIHKLIVSHYEAQSIEIMLARLRNKV